MRVLSSQQQILSFQIATTTTIGNTALETVSKVFRQFNLEKPFWVLPSEVVQQRTVKRIIGKKYDDTSKTYFQTASVIVAPETDILDLLQTTHHIQEGQFDCIVICGDAQTIQRGKLLGLLDITKHDKDSTSIEDLMLLEPQSPSLPIITVPCGESDGSDYLGTIHYQEKSYYHKASIPIHSIGDGRLTRCTTPKNIARTMCCSLMHICTTILANANNPMLMGVVDSGIFYAHQTLELLLEPALSGQHWIDCTLSASATAHAAGICAQNRGDSSIIAFAERLAIKGLADQYQTMAAMLPYVCMLIKKSNEPVYENFKQLLRGMELVEFGKAWLSLTEPRGTDRILQQLCGDMHDLLMYPKNVRELEPLLSLFPVEGGLR